MGMIKLTSKDSRRMKGDRKLVYTRPLSDNNSRCLHSWLQGDRMLALNCPPGNGNTWKSRRRHLKWHYNILDKRIQVTSPQTFDHQLESRRNLLSWHNSIHMKVLNISLKHQGGIVHIRIPILDSSGITRAVWPGQLPWETAVQLCWQWGSRQKSPHPPCVPGAQPCCYPPVIKTGSSMAQWQAQQLRR